MERERTRADVCRAHGVVLITIAPDGEPRVALRNVETSLSRAAAQLARNAAVPHAAKQKLMPQLSTARRRAGEFTAKLNPPEKLNLYAEMRSFLASLVVDKLLCGDPATVSPLSHARQAARSRR